VKVGDNVNIDFAIGKTLVRGGGTRLFQLGLAGYAEFQLSEDSGDQALVAPRLGKDRVFALGPEVGFILPQEKLNFLVRVLPEFGAHSRTSGVTIVAAGGKSF